MRPICKLMINGKPAGGFASSRIISVEVDDKEGVSSDLLTVVLHNSPAARIPKKNSIVKVWLGYGVPRYMGAYMVSDVDLDHFPHKMTIKCKAADYRGTAKSSKKRHWDKSTVKQIVSDVAKDLGLSAEVDGEFASHKYEYLAQETDNGFQFLEKLANKLGAMFAAKDGKLIFASRGSGKNTFGTALGGLVITPDMLLPGGPKIKLKYSKQVKQVTANYVDRKKAERGEVKAESISEAESTFHIGTPLADMAEAKLATKAKAKELKQASFVFNGCTIVGNPSARAGMMISFAGLNTGVDGHPFIVGNAKHKYVPNGYTVALSGKQSA